MKFTIASKPLLAALLGIGAARAAPSPAPASASSPATVGNVSYTTEVEYWAANQSPDKRGAELQARGPSVYVCGGPNWSGPCTTLNFDANTHVGIPYQTFGSVDAHGWTCHCWNGGDVYSSPFSWENDVEAHWGGYWFWECNNIGCW